MPKNIVEREDDDDEHDADVAGSGGHAGSGEVCGRRRKSLGNTLVSVNYGSITTVNQMKCNGNTYSSIIHSTGGATNNPATNKQELTEDVRVGARGGEGGGGGVIITAVTPNTMITRR